MKKFVDTFGQEYRLYMGVRIRNGNAYNAKYSASVNGRQLLWADTLDGIKKLIKQKILQYKGDNEQ